MYINEFRTKQCPLFLQQQCQFHRPYTCFYWHFPNQRRRRPIKKSDGTFNYNPDIYCNTYDENTGACAYGDECPYAHKNASDSERRYHPRYFKTGTCVYETTETGSCVKNGLHCAFAHGPDDLRQPVYDIRESMPHHDTPINLSACLEKERVLSEDPKWNEMFHVLAYYKIDLCRKPPRMCRQGYSCPYYHNGKDKRRPPSSFFYRSTPCPSVRPNDEWLDSSLCRVGDACLCCHTRTEQQFHPEIYKSTKCNDVLSSGYCPRGSFCAFAHTDAEVTIGRDYINALAAAQLTSSSSTSSGRLGPTGQLLRHQSGALPMSSGGITLASSNYPPLPTPAHQGRVRSRSTRASSPPHHQWSQPPPTPPFAAAAAMVSPFGGVVNRLTGATASNTFGALPSSAGRLLIQRDSPRLAQPPPSSSFFHQSASGPTLFNQATTVKVQSRMTTPGVPPHHFHHPPPMSTGPADLSDFAGQQNVFRQLPRQGVNRHQISSRLASEGGILVRSGGGLYGAVGQPPSSSQQTTPPDKTGLWPATATDLASSSPIDSPLGGGGLWSCSTQYGSPSMDSGLGSDQLTVGPNRSRIVDPLLSSSLLQQQADNDHSSSLHLVGSAGSSSNWSPDLFQQMTSPGDGQPHLSPHDDTGLAQGCGEAASNNVWAASPSLLIAANRRSGPLATGTGSSLESDDPWSSGCTHQKRRLGAADPLFDLDGSTAAFSPPRDRFDDAEGQRRDSWFDLPLDDDHHSAKPTSSVSLGTSYDHRSGLLFQPPSGAVNNGSLDCRSGGGGGSLPHQLQRQLAGLGINDPLSPRSLERQLSEIRHRLDSKEGELESLKRQRDSVSEQLRDSLDMIQQLVEAASINLTPSTTSSIEGIQSTTDSSTQQMSPSATLDDASRQKAALTTLFSNPVIARLMSRSGPTTMSHRPDLQQVSSAWTPPTSTQPLSSSGRRDNHSPVAMGSGGSPADHPSSSNNSPSSKSSPSN